MISNELLGIPLVAGAFLSGLLLSLFAKWRLWVAAVVTSLAAVVVGAIFQPMVFELGNAIMAFLPALAGAALGLFVHRKRTA